MIRVTEKCGGPRVVGDRFLRITLCEAMNGQGVTFLIVGSKMHTWMKRNLQGRCRLLRMFVLRVSYGWPFKLPL